MGESKREVLVLREQARGCGFRKAGPTGVGIYLMGPGASAKCERLPMPLTVCPCCGEGIKFSRAFTWVMPGKLFAPYIEPTCMLHDERAEDLQELDMLSPHNHEACPMCNAEAVAGVRAGLLWIGQNHYSPQAFKREAALMGISRRLPNIPRGFAVGEHWVYLAHKLAAFPEGWPDCGPDAKSRPGVFYVFRPTHVDLVIDDPEDIPERAHRLADRLGDAARLVTVIPEIESQGELFEGGE